MADDRADEAGSGIVDAVHFSFLSAEEIRKMSVKKITKSALLDAKMSPIPDGLCDPAMGPLNDESCKTCGNLSFRCPGHCGHIDFALPIYNPLLFGTLCSLLQNTCFFCHNFRMKKEKVQMYTGQLDFIIKGDIASARNMATLSAHSLIDGEDLDKSHRISNDESFPTLVNFNQGSWTSLQHTEAMSVLLKFMREKIKKCQNCGNKNPKISSPVYGMINMVMQSSDIRANVIMGSNHELSLTDLDKLKSSVSEGLALSGEVEESVVADGMNESLSTYRKLPSEFIKQKKMFSGQLLPSEVKYHLEKLWSNESRFCSLICDIQQKRSHFSMEKSSYSIFLMEALLVTPNKFRPTSKSDLGRALEHPQNILLTQVLDANNAIIGSDGVSRVQKWMDLQRRVNVLFDSSKGFGKEKEVTGLRQLLEKKAGILRQKMMGKRVNFACRSVISPDPYLAVNEIGIPPQFALKLTYPERVTPWNVNKLRQCILNGTEFHPGATHFKDRDRLMTLKVPRNVRLSISRKLPTSRGSHGQATQGPESEVEGKIVYRHLEDGDSVLANRQPTLHKISMMALSGRIIKGEKTLRMHYANCSSYNADFDGDEMNVHLPQDDVSRAEAINIVNANRQYVLPASGKPVRGLIQDHIVSAVLLTKKDTFLTKEEYYQLLYASSVPPIFCGSSIRKSSKKIHAVCSESVIQPLLPAILKPKPLWSGKQVITAILNHITRGRHPFTVKKSGKISKEYLAKQGKSYNNEKQNQEKGIKGFDHDEFEMHVYKNEMLYGVIDKEQFGLYGLVHTVHELYGPDSAGSLLSVFSRLFTIFLQMHGFTCGVDDLLIVPKSDVGRKKVLESCERKSEETHSYFVDANVDDIDPMELQKKLEEVLRRNGEAATTRLDRNMSSTLNQITSSINENLVPGGLLKPFSRNCVSLMTATGAKGSSVNFNQISSLLGQQELEGKRVPRMVSGKTLPSFPPWDIAPRAGGFISDRFLSGLRPQEYYFHCMAGREGLVDTAIKTSRSGYLQRCLIKNLESLKVSYDFTVRDVDGSVIQFIYGEDGVDVHQTSFLNQFETLAANRKVILEGHKKKIEVMDLSKSNGYLQEIPPGLKKKAENFLVKLSRKQRELLRLKKEKNLMEILMTKYLKSLAQPGEAVGVLASQSLGEQTTQMTLNTFHLAGRGDVNVTLGIPRLQEILMNAKEKIRTPVMTCPLRKELTWQDAESLASKLRRITIADIVESIEVCVVPFCVSNRKVTAVYKLKMRLYSPELYPECSGITLETCQKTFECDFVPALDSAIKRHLGTLAKISGIKMASSKEEGSLEEGDEEEADRGEVNYNGSSGEEETTEDQGADAQKRKMQACDEVEYDDNDDEDDDGDVKRGSIMVDDINDDDHVQHSGSESEVDQAGAVMDHTMAEVSHDPSDDDEPENLSKMQTTTEAGTKKNQQSDAGKKTSTLKRKGKTLERVVFVQTRGLDFEVHLEFTNEPHVLLAEIAQRTAKTVYVKKSSNIDQCCVIKEAKDGIETYQLQTAGVSFSTFWDLEEYLDITQISTNDICAILRTYGVEAARAAIIQEVNYVFKAYGISVDIRHLALTADFMTFNGDYRAMNRGAMTSYGTSPFGKITFETATKFIVEAALHGEVDKLESPSASICLGQPIKMGTGCFDLLQDIQLK